MNNDFINIEAHDWSWSLENGLAVLREPSRPDARYNEEGVKLEVANVKANRASYATQEAWERQLRKFEHGAALFALAVAGGDIGGSNPVEADGLASAPFK